LITFELIVTDIYRKGQLFISASQPFEEFRAKMTRFWVIKTVLLGCFLLGNACKHCVLKEQCLEEKPLTNDGSK